MHGWSRSAASVTTVRNDVISGIMDSLCLQKESLCLVDAARLGELVRAADGTLKVSVFIPTVLILRFPTNPET